MRLLPRRIVLSCTLLLSGAVGSGCAGYTAALGAYQTCVGGNCELGCTGDGCEPGCSGDGCEPGCTGDDCEPGCSGDHCEPGCIGDACEPFSIILLPDTQYYTSKQPNNSSNTYHKQAQWLVEHRDLENLKFAIHLGDITNNNTAGQWQIASHAHALLDAAHFPYSITTGNHDYLNGSNPYSRSNSRYPEHFGKARFEGKPFYGGSQEDGNFNNYTFFESGPYKFMVLSLEYAPRKDTLCWADELIRQHPDRRVIIATHCYMDQNKLMSCPSTSYHIEGASGAATFAELVQRHSNVFMVVAGHVSGSAYLEAEGLNGNPIHQILVDYQSESACTESDVNLCNNHCAGTRSTGNGWMRKLTFNPKTNTVFASTFTVEEGEERFFPGGVPAFFCSELNASTQYPYYGALPTSKEHLFSFPYALTSPVTYAYSNGASQAFTDRSISEPAAAEPFSPRITMDGAGNFVAVWEGSPGIFMRGFHAGGCQKFSSRAVHRNQAGNPKQPDVASDANGNFVVVWSEEVEGSGRFQIRMRGFNPDGSERFAEQTVGSVVAGWQHNPRIAMAPGGQFTVVWEGSPQQSAPYQVYARGFNADGSQRVAQWVVNPETEGSLLLPVVAVDNQGRSVVIWGEDAEGSGAFQLYGRAFNADGSQWLARFTVNTVTNLQHPRPAVGMDASGNFVVAWEDSRAGASQQQVYARGYTHTGGQLFAGKKLSSVARQQLRPSLGMSSDGTFVVAWAEYFNVTRLHDIRAHGFHADGSPWWAAPRTINKKTNGQQKAPAVGLSEARFVVHLWEDDMDGDGIMGSGL